MGKVDFKKITYELNLDLANSGLVVDSFGNASARTKKDTFCIKPTGAKLNDINFNDISEVNFEGKVLSGLKPSSDTPTHLELYKAFDDIGGIIHSHSLYATAWAQAKLKIPCFGTTHADYWQGSIPITRDLKNNEIRSEYEKETGAVIIEKLKEIEVSPLECPGILVSSHGPFCWGASIEDAFKNAIRLEYIAKIAFLTISINPKINNLGQALHDKHFLRKHGIDAYYGQDSD